MDKTLWKCKNLLLLVFAPTMCRGFFVTKKILVTLWLHFWLQHFFPIYRYLLDFVTNVTKKTAKTFPAQEYG